MDLPVPTVRLLYLNPTASMGGAERVLAGLLDTVCRAQPSWVVGLIVGGDGPLVEEARRLGVETTVLALPRALSRIGDAGLSGPVSWMRFGLRAARSGFALLAYVRRLRRAVEAFGPDLVHAHGFKMHLLGALVRPKKAALLWHFHDYLGSRRVTNRLIRALSARCSVIVAVSESVARDARQQLGEGVQIRTVWNAVDLAQFSPQGPHVDLDALSGLPPAAAGVVRVGLIATFARWKGHLVFLEALRELARSHAIRGYIIGGPLYETDDSQYSMEELREAVARCGLSGTVGLTGFLRDAAPAFRELDVVVHASTSPEPFGLVIAEAMATGKSVVVSSAGGAAELVHPERDALTFPLGDQRALASQLQRLIADAALRQQLGAAAREAAVERFSPARAGGQMLRLYDQFGSLAAA